MAQCARCIRQAGECGLCYKHHEEYHGEPGVGSRKEFLHGEYTLHGKFKPASQRMESL